MADAIRGDRGMNGERALKLVKGLRVGSRRRRRKIQRYGRYCQRTQWMTGGRVEMSAKIREMESLRLSEKAVK